MRKPLFAVVTVATALSSTLSFAQGPKAATYITDEEVKKVSSLPGTDRQIKVVDIGTENLAVGIIHRGRSAAAASTPMPAVAPAQAQGEPCGEQGSSPGARDIVGG